MATRSLSGALPNPAPEKRAILLVEDQEDDALLVRRTLAQGGLGCPVTRVKSAYEAMSYLKGEYPYDDRESYPFPVIVLLDIGLPQMDGFELLGWIRHTAEFPLLPVAMLTGSDRMQDARRAYELGATSFFVKPFDFSDAREVCGTLERLIAKATGRQPLE